MKNWRFYRALRGRRDDHGRRMTSSRLAELATASAKNRAHISRVLNGARRGRFTRPLLFPHLTSEEIELLGWQDEYAEWRQKQKTFALTDGQRCAEQRSTGNIVPKIN